MSTITTTFEGGNYKPKPKSFSFSYTKLKNYDVCPKRHYNVDVIKSVKEEEGEALQWGNSVHKAMAARCKDGTALPSSMKGYEKWAARAVTFPGNMLVEQQLAIDEDFKATKWFDSDAKAARLGLPWYRGVADVLKIHEDTAYGLDWKTGKVLDDAPQLGLMAACVFAHYPHVVAIRTEFIWLKENAKTVQDFTRESMPALWRSLWPRIEALKHAHQTSDYPAKPGHLCRNYCPVTSCVHNGKH